MQHYDKFCEFTANENDFCVMLRVTLHVSTFPKRKEKSGKRIMKICFFDHIYFEAKFTEAQKMEIFC